MFKLFVLILVFILLSSLIYLSFTNEVQTRKTKAIIALVSLLIGGQFIYRVVNNNLLISVQCSMGASMEPTLPTAPSFDLFTSVFTPKRGDIIGLKLESETNYFCKRIIGMPGDLVIVYGDEIYINGELLDESGYTINPCTAHYADTVILLGEDEYFVMGDNRPVSYDSRYFGAVKRSEIKTKHLTVLCSVPFGELLVD